MTAKWLVLVVAAALLAATRGSNGDDGAGATVSDPSFVAAADSALAFLRKALNGEQRECRAKEKNPLFPSLPRADQNRLLEEAGAVDVGEAYVWHHQVVLAAGRVWKLYLDYGGFKVYAEVAEDVAGNEAPASPDDAVGAAPEFARFQLVRLNPAACDIRPGSPAAHEPEEFAQFRESQGQDSTSGAGARFARTRIGDAYGLLGAGVEPVDSVAHRALRFSRAPEKPLPEAYDARGVHGACKSLRSTPNQERCGGSWAFAAASVLADRVCVKSEGAVNEALSPQSLIACAAEKGCATGTLREAFSFTEDYGGPGLVSEACDPFTGRDRTGGARCDDRCKSPAAAFYTKPDSLLFRYGATAPGSPAPELASNEERIMREVLEHGPVATVIKAYDSLFTYRGGVYRPGPGEQWHEGAYHAVKLLGWGTEGGRPYWLLQNWWGPAWGEKGFFRLDRRDARNFVSQYGVVAPDPEVPAHLVGGNPCKNGGTHLGNGSCACEGPFGGRHCRQCAARCENGGVRVEGGREAAKTESGCTCADSWTANGESHRGCSTVPGHGSLCVVQEEGCGMRAGNVSYDWCQPVPEDTCRCECPEGFFGPRCQYGMFVDPDTADVCMGDSVSFQIYAADSTAGDRVFVRSARFQQLYGPSPSGLNALAGGEVEVCSPGSRGRDTQCAPHVKVQFTAPTEPGAYIAQYAKSRGVNAEGHAAGMEYNWHPDKQASRFTVHNCAKGAKVFTPPRAKGADDHTCPNQVLHCRTSGWSDWSACSATCNGRQHRTRSMLVEPTKCGRECGSLREERACNAECDASGEPRCRFSAWSEWSECSASCRGGVKRRSRDLLPGSHGACGPLVQEESCNTHECRESLPPACPPVPAKRYTTAGQACVPFRYGGVAYPAGNCTAVDHGREWCFFDKEHWAECRPLRHSREGKNCIFPFDFDDRTYHNCAQLTEGAPAQCATAVDTQVHEDGSARVVARELQACAPCRQDCQLGEWSEWGQCSAQCGGGEQTRRREVLAPARNGGAACTGARVEARACGTAPCPRQCVYSRWSRWSACSKPCGRGQQVRTRALLEDAGTADAPCNASRLESRECNTAECAPQEADQNMGDVDRAKLREEAGERRDRVEEERRKVEDGEKPEGAQPSAAEEGRLPQCPPLAFNARRTLTGRACAPFDDGREQHRGSCSVRGTGGREWCQTAEGTWDYCAPLRNTTSGGGCILPFRFEGETVSDCVSMTRDGQRVHVCAAEVTEDRVVTSAAVCRPCVRDCVVSEWGEWSKCTAPCGQGVRTRRRHVVALPQNGGEQCPPLLERQPCNEGACQLDCKVGNWSRWSDCSLPCGGGVQSSSRPVLQAPRHGGTACPAPLTRTRACNTHTCGARAGTVSAGPGCKTTPWSEWSECTASCGGGERVRFRAILAGDEQRCGAVVERKPCNEQACSASRPPACPNATEPRVTVDGRRCVAAEYKGVLHPASKCFARSRGGTEEWCYTAADKSTWGRCRPLRRVAGHGGAEDKRCILPFRHNGRTHSECVTSRSQGLVCPTRVSQDVLSAADGSLVEARRALAWDHCAPCAQACQLTNWTTWTECSATCGGGEQYRYRGVMQPAHNGGARCAGPFAEARPCNVEACEAGEAAGSGGAPSAPAPTCRFSEWGPWSTCTAACGGGQRVRHRTLRSGLHDLCASGVSETQPCNTAACEPEEPRQDCELSPWTPWSSCSAECGGGEQRRTRLVMNPSRNGGKACGALVESRRCNTAHCRDCKLGDWTSWSNCSANCGGGSQTRRRVVVHHATGHGASCPNATELEQERSCNEEACPSDCKVSDWGAWTQCSATCGGGEKERRRAVLREAGPGGRVCPHLVEEARCNAKPCPVDCEMSAWSAWTQCNATCGGGVRRRARSVLTPNAHGGRECPALRQEEPCNEQPCPVDCKVGAWSPWSNCSASCGGGKQSRTRIVQQPAANGGAPCPALSEEQPCNQQACPNTPQGCMVSEWGPWSKCSRSCGGGVRTSTRTVKQQPEEGGAACPALSRKEPCNEQACDCEVSEWGAWSSCSAACGGGSRTRERTVLQHPTKGGQVCPDLREEDTCNEHHCPVNCTLSAFGAWSGCSVPCGGGKQYRFRSVLKPAAHGGACGAQHDVRQCNEHSCKQCLLGPWSKWSSCSQTCGGGTRSRRRSVRFMPRGWSQCPEKVYEVEQCNTWACSAGGDDEEPCPVYNQTRVAASGATCHASHFASRFYPRSECISLGTGHGKEWCFVNAEQTKWDWCKPLRTTTSGRGCVLPFQHGNRTYTDCAEYGDDGLSACAVEVDVNGQATKFGLCKPCQPSVARAPPSAAASVAMAPPTVSKRDMAALARRAAEEEKQQPRYDVDVNQLATAEDAPKQEDGQEDTGTDVSEAEAEAESAAMDSADEGGDEGPSDGAESAAEAEDAADAIMLGTSSTGSATGSVASDDAFASAELPSAEEMEEAEMREKAQVQEDAQPEADDDASSPRGSAAAPGSTGGDSGAGSGAPKPAPMSKTLKDMSALVRSVQQSDAVAGAECPDLDAARRTLQGETCVSFVTRKGRAVIASECALSASGAEWCVTNRTSRAWGYCRPLRVTLSGVPCIFPFTYNGVEYHDCLRTQAGSICATTVDRASRELLTPGFCQACRERSPDSVGPRDGSSEALSAQLGAEAPAQPPRRVAAGVAFGDGSGQHGEDAREQGAAKGASTKAAAPVDCVLGDWNAWSECSKTCDGGVQYRTRDVLTYPRHGGRKCGPVEEKRECASWACPPKCEYGPWSTWSKCSSSCGGGVQRRRRHLVGTPLSMEHCKPVEEETRSCNAHACPVDCEVGEWSEWSKCSVLCGRGEQTRSRVVVEPRSGAGRSCPPLMESRPCNQASCAGDPNVNCEVGEWSTWSACSKRCGHGVQNRTRDIMVRPKGGLDCPATMEERACNEQPCPVDCKVSAWAEWGACSATCGGGKRVRKRTVEVAPAHGGVACPVTKESEDCNTEPCSVECTVGPWSQWSNCSADCGGGVRTRVRSITQLPVHGGASCPALKEERPCAEEPCALGGMPVVASDDSAEGADTGMRVTSVLSRKERRRAFCDSLEGPSEAEGPCAALFGSGAEVRTFADARRAAPRLGAGALLQEQDAAVRGGVQGIVEAREARNSEEVLDELAGLGRRALEAGPGEVDEEEELRELEKDERRNAAEAEEALADPPTGATGAVAQGSVSGGDAERLEAAAEAAAEDAEAARDKMLGKTGVDDEEEDGLSLAAPRAPDMCDVGRELVLPLLRDAQAALRRSAGGRSLESGKVEDMVFDAARSREQGACGGMSLEMDRKLGKEVMSRFVVEDEVTGREETLGEQQRLGQARAVRDERVGAASAGAGPAPVEPPMPGTAAAAVPSPAGAASSNAGATGAMGGQIEKARRLREEGTLPWPTPAATTWDGGVGVGALDLTTGEGVRRSAGEVAERTRRKEARQEARERRLAERDEEEAEKVEEEDAELEAADTEVATGGTGAPGATGGVSVAGHVSMDEEPLVPKHAGDFPGGPGRSPVGADGPTWSGRGSRYAGSADGAEASARDVARAEAAFKNPYPEHSPMTGPTGNAGHAESEAPDAPRQPAASPTPEVPAADPHDRTSSDFVRRERVVEAEVEERMAEDQEEGQEDVYGPGPRTARLRRLKRVARERGHALERRRLASASQSMQAFLWASLHHASKACDREMRRHGEAPVSVHLASLQSSMQLTSRQLERDRANEEKLKCRVDELEKAVDAAKARVAEAQRVFEQTKNVGEDMLTAGGNARSHKAAKLALQRAADAVSGAREEAAARESDVRAGEKKLRRLREAVGVAEQSLARKWATARRYLEACKQVDM